MNTLLLCCKNNCECYKNLCDNLSESNEKITLIICVTVVLLLFTAMVASLIWYWPKRTPPQGDTKKETTNNPTSAFSKKSESELEYERWFSLKKEYQRLALDYIRERSLVSKTSQNGQESGIDDCNKFDKRIEPNNSCETDAYLEYIDKYISQIDKKLEEVSLSKWAEEKNELEASPANSEESTKDIQ